MNDDNRMIGDLTNLDGVAVEDDIDLGDIDSIRMHSNRPERKHLTQFKMRPSDETRRDGSSRSSYQGRQCGAIRRYSDRMLIYLPE